MVVINFKTQQWQHITCSTSKIRIMVVTLYTMVATMLTVYAPVAWVRKSNSVFYHQLHFMLVWHYAVIRNCKYFQEYHVYVCMYVYILTCQSDKSKDSQKCILWWSHDWNDHRFCYLFPGNVIITNKITSQEGLPNDTSTCMANFVIRKSICNLSMTCDWLLVQQIAEISKALWIYIKVCYVYWNFC